MEMKCLACDDYPVYSLHFTGKEWLCSKCYRAPPTRANVTGSDTIFIPDYGHVSKARLDELGRREILPYEKPGGGYYLGRRGENGKIQERWPNYSK